MSPIYKTATQFLDKAEAPELTLIIDSFAGGENTIGQDYELKANEARTIENWDANSLGGMIRSKGFTKVASSVTYTTKYDLLIQHFEGTSTATFGINSGNLVKKSGAGLALDHASDAASFASGTLCGAVSAGSALWITNRTDSLKKKVIGAAVVAPTTTPTTASDRIYEMNFRLIAEGNTAKTVYGSRAGTGNWTGAGGWSTSNDAWSIVMPDLTQGCVPGFPSGTDLTVFTEFDTFVIYNQPNVARRRIQNGIGCSAPFSIARGNEGVFFLSTYPTLGIFLWDGVNFTNLTQYHDFVDDIAQANRMFGTYKDHKYFFIYNETGSGTSVPNRLRIYDAKFGRWMNRPINSSNSDTFGYPALLTKDNNELYLGSSGGSNLYDFEDSSTSDNTYSTAASYTTKTFMSQDFQVSGGGQFPLTNVRMKLLKITVSYKGFNGNFTVNWSADHGARSGSSTFAFSTVDGDLINSTFIVNTSYVVSTSGLSEKIVTKSFNNAAVGRGFTFQINQTGTSDRPEIRAIKIVAIALEEE